MEIRKLDILDTFDTEESYIDASYDNTESLDDVMMSVLNVKGLDSDNLLRVISAVENRLHKEDKAILKRKGIILSDKYVLPHRVVLNFLRICLDKLAEEVILAIEEGGY